MSARLTVCTEHFCHRMKRRLHKLNSLNRDIFPYFRERIVPRYKGESFVPKERRSEYYNFEVALSPQERKQWMKDVLIPTIGEEHLYALPSDPASVKQKILDQEKAIVQLEAQLRATTRRECRAREMVTSVVDEINHLLGLPEAQIDLEKEQAVSGLINGLRPVIEEEFIETKQVDLNDIF